jgi:exosortase
VTRSDLIAGGALALGSMAVAFDAWSSILQLGTAKEELSYVLLAPILIGWIAWHMRGRWAQCALRHGWFGLLVLAFGWVVFSYGFLHDPVLWRAGAVFMVMGAFVTAVGTGVVWRFLPAFAACAFLIPIYPNGRYQIAAPLQVATAAATQTVCDILGIYVERSGSLLTINGVGVAIAEGCNGLRMVMTLFLVCYLVAFTSPLRPWLRVLLLLASPLVAVIANVIRLVPTVWMFGHYSNDVAETFHSASGWAMIVLSFLGLMSLCRAIEGAVGATKQTTHVVRKAGVA